MAHFLASICPMCDTVYVDTDHIYVCKVMSIYMLCFIAVEATSVSFHFVLNSPPSHIEMFLCLLQFNLIFTINLLLQVQRQNSKANAGTCSGKFREKAIFPEVSLTYTSRCALAPTQFRWIYHYGGRP